MKTLNTKTIYVKCSRIDSNRKQNVLVRVSKIDNFGGYTTYRIQIDMKSNLETIAACIMLPEDYNKRPKTAAALLKWALKKCDCVIVK